MCEILVRVGCGWAKNDRNDYFDFRLATATTTRRKERGKKALLSPDGVGRLRDAEPRENPPTGASGWRAAARRANPPDIEKALWAQQEAVRITPEGSEDLPKRLSNLGGSFVDRFERSGELSDIAEAISALQRAVQLTPEHTPYLPALLTNLGGTYLRRFGRTSELSDITEAITVQRKAVKLTYRKDASMLNNLGISLDSRYGMTGDLSDVTEAVSALRLAVKLTPPAHADLPSRLTNLGSALQLRFEQTVDSSDIEEAISVQRRAVQLTPYNHATLPGWINNLGNSLQARFKQARNLSDIDEAIAIQSQAVNIMPHGHSTLPNLLGNLGQSFLLRFSTRGEREDLNQCISRHKDAATYRVGSPRSKLNSATIWAQLLVKHYPQSPDILPAFDTALSLVALIAGLEQTVRGRYEQLKGASGIAVEAAAAALSLERPDKALEWLEQGRCLVWIQLSNLRTPLDDLRLQNQELADRIAEVSKQLETAGSSRATGHLGMSMLEKISVEDEARSHLSLAKLWDDLLQEARAIPGFETFLRPVPCSTLLQHLPEEGPIVVINVDKHRCDAIALLNGMDEPLHIPLPNFSLKKANDYRSRLKAQLRSQGLRDRAYDHDREVVDSHPTLLARPLRPVIRGNPGENIVRGVLRGLWVEVAKPILDHLSIPMKDESSDVPLRLWWCLTGPLSFLPIHAAGVYLDSNREGVLDYVISSYTPTVTALADQVKNPRSINTHVSGVFFTSQPNAPGASSIPGTAKEVQSIYSSATRNGVRSLMVEGSALTNAAEPLQSRFLFQNGSLHLATIIQRKLKNADLAFLSACQTSTGEEKLSDEAVHLAAGMLAAGYRRVVATMWSISDSAAQEVAINFYEYLWSKRGEVRSAAFDGSLAAYALHDAIQRLMGRLDNSERSLLTWVPFVHFGY
ncbi:hypothetical protein D9611_014450 [Ephemerocybe angulata]|uniref:CHAT domain-containing protein n=1 Tax=Ephemerocybe angulata TaxID=980116 RepID=A0A8H5ERK5_9AGAR|nr:hypothetical protein D9611_014450 [Tulosesus angulatus]